MRPTRLLDSDSIWEIYKYQNLFFEEVIVQKVDRKGMGLVIEYTDTKKTRSVSM